MKQKITKLANGLELMHLSADVDQMPTRGRVHMRAPLREAVIVPDAKLVEKLAAAGKSSLWSFVPGQQKNDNFNFDSVTDVLPADGDYIKVQYRALSKTLIPGHWLDLTRDNVLEDSTQMLLGQTVYPNHDFSDINNWLGVVSAVQWDANDSAGKGAPGLNAEYTIDALMNPRIARGLLMKPPAIHSTSMTFLFDFEYSHPDIATESRYKFFELLGEEVGGEIVRLIVTQIHAYWEASLVFQGADDMAKRIQEDDEDPEAESFSAKLAERAAETQPHSNEETPKMKVIEDQKKSLGIECEGEDVPETDVLNAALALAEKVKGLPGNVAELQEQAAAGVVLLEEKRTAVSAKAKLAELGADEGDLDEVIVEQINSASAEQLTKLDKYYDKRIGDKYPNGRSSVEDPKSVEDAGGVNLDAEKTVSDGGLFS